jgi:uncharacterized membrane protein
MSALVSRTKTVLIRLAAVALVALFGALALGSGVATAATGDAAWTVRTASNNFGADRTSYSYTLKPGGTIKDAMVVFNHGTAPLKLGVYAADGYTTKSGQFDLLTKDHKSVDIGAWVHSDAATVTIQPGKAASLPFTVSLPANATPGDHAGGILTSLVPAVSQDGINVDRRLGIKIKLRVSGELKPSLSVEKLHLNIHGTSNPFGDGDATVSYVIHNTGNALASSQQAVWVSGPFGWLRVTASAKDTPPQLLPGESWKVSVPVHGVSSAVRMAAHVAVTPVITEASGSTTTLKAVNASTHAWAIPWTLALLLVALIAMLIVGVLYLRASRLKRKLREDARVEQAVKQALVGAESDAR